MADKYYIYTVMHSLGPNNQIRFLMFKKHVLAHYFGPTDTDKHGSIFPDGAQPPLHGGGDYAFPGGGFKPGGDKDGDWTNDVDFCNAAGREFTEEVGRTIAFSVQDGGGEDDVAAHGRSVECDVDIKRWNGGTRRGVTTYYGALFLQMPNDELDAMRDYASACFQQADDAVYEIQHQTIDAYDQVPAQYPISPIDDELGEAFVHDFDDPDPFVESLQYSNNTSWFYQMICYLEDL